ncbi:MAG: hypothetical protein ACRDSL_07590 [Pseudonocardiaceae bacterium]
MKAPPLVPRRVHAVSHRGARLLPDTVAAGAKEQDRRRKLILSAIASLPVSAIYVTERGESLDARSACWQQLVPMLLTANVSQLVIERLTGVEACDERDVGDALRKPTRSAR